jgi:cephalosporin hydroxylase
MYYSDYHDVLKQDLGATSLTNANRFVSITERTDTSDLPKEAWGPLLTNPFAQIWGEIVLNKCPLEIALYPMLLHELRPKTIIELGALNGGSAVWLADHVDIFQLECVIYSLDIDLSLLHDKAKADKRIHFIQGDCNDLSPTFSPELLTTLAHPWLVIEDAHANLIGVLEYFHNYGLQSGDYLIVEDTNQFMWEYWRDHWEDQEEIERGYQKMIELRKWLMSHSNEYLIDTHYQDMYGQNGSKCWNSILKRV